MSRAQLLLRIELPEGTRVYPSEFREYVAKAMDLLPACPALFHYDGSGKPANGIPLTRFVGGRSWLGIITDESQADVLYQAMGPAVKAVEHLCGKLTPMRIERQTLEIKPLPFGRKYWIREMAAKRRGPRARSMPDDQLIRERLLAGLARQAEEFGLKWPGDEALQLRDITVTKARGLALSTTGGVTREYVSLFDASFTINAELLGYWFAGSLPSRGYGRIGYDLVDLAVNYRAEERRPRRLAA